MFNFMNSRVGIFTSCTCGYGTRTHYERTFSFKKTTFILQERKVVQKEKMCYLPALYFITLAFKLPFLDDVSFCLLNVKSS